MAEIAVSMGEFRRLMQEQAAQVFESGELVAMAYGPHLVKAYKKTRPRLFRRAIPMLKIGYSGVAHWEMEPARNKKAKRS